jgi:hypothetical protein
MHIYIIQIYTKIQIYIIISTSSKMQNNECHLLNIYSMLKLCNKSFSSFLMSFRDAVLCRLREGKDLAKGCSARKWGLRLRL